MLVQQQQIQFSTFSGLYDLIVPKDNLLRKISELIYFTFIYEELVDKYCPNNGRSAESPVRMFEYLLLKTICTIRDVDIVERSQYDMLFKYFLEMSPRGGSYQSGFRERMDHQRPAESVKGASLSCRKLDGLATR